MAVLVPRAALESRVDRNKQTAVTEPWHFQSRPRHSLVAACLDRGWVLQRRAPRSLGCEWSGLQRPPGWPCWAHWGTRAWLLCQTRDHVTPEDALRPPLAPEWLREGRGWRRSRQPRGEDVREDREGAEAWRQVWESPGEPAPQARAGLLMPAAPERPQPSAFVSKALTPRGPERTHVWRCTRFLPPPPKPARTRGRRHCPGGRRHCPHVTGEQRKRRGAEAF